MGVEQRVSEEQKEKWYNSFTREQLIERCEYLQRSCERKEDTIIDREMEIADLVNIINKAIEYIEKNSYTTLETIDDINYFIVRLDKCPDLLDILKGSDKE